MKIKYKSKKVFDSKTRLLHLISVVSG